MIEINIELDEGNKVYEFPTSWSEITVDQFKNLYSINKDIHSGMFYTFEVIHQLSGIEREIIEQIDFDSFSQLIEQMKFIYEPIEEKKSQSIVIDGEEYFLYNDFNKYTAGEIISLETILSSANHEIYKIIPELLCIFLRKKTPKGNLEKYKTTFMERREIFKQIKIDEINHIFANFLTGRDLSANNTQVSSKNNEK